MHGCIVGKLLYTKIQNDYLKNIQATINSLIIVYVEFCRFLGHYDVIERYFADIYCEQENCGKAGMFNNLERLI